MTVSNEVSRFRIEVTPSLKTIVSSTASAREGAARERIKPSAQARTVVTIAVPPLLVNTFSF
jgi:hypothetical protein